jgi:hypothetical protein
LSLYTDLQKANLAAAKATIRALNVTITYQHRDKPVITLYARPMIENKERVEQMKGGKETALRGFEIYAQSDVNGTTGVFPPPNDSNVVSEDADNITIGDGIGYNNHDYRIDSIVDVAGLGQIFQCMTSRCRMVNPGGKAE